jgi:hypothetical protein
VIKRSYEGAGRSRPDVPFPAFDMVVGGKLIRDCRPAPGDGETVSAGVQGTTAISIKSVAVDAASYQTAHSTL